VSPTGKKLLRRLNELGIEPKAKSLAKEAAELPLAGKTFVLTGTLPSMTREEATEKIERSRSRHRQRQQKNRLRPRGADLAASSTRQGTGVKSRGSRVSENVVTAVSRHHSCAALHHDAPCASYGEGVTSSSNDMGSTPGIVPGEASSTPVRLAGALLRERASHF